MTHPPSLRELQRLFFRAIAAAPGETTAAPRLLAFVEPSATLDRGARLGAYADAYLWRLVEVLREDFPRVAAIVGDDAFRDLVRRYVQRHPSTHPSVAMAGRRFPAFLARCRDLPPYLPDVARLERTRLEVFAAADVDRLTRAGLQAVSADAWPQLRLATIPALRMLRVRWTVDRLWTAGGAESVEALPTALRVWRTPDHRVFHAPMDGRAARALARLRAGRPFADVCAVFADLPGARGAEEAGALLARWIDDGIVGGLQRAPR